MQARHDLLKALSEDEIRVLWNSLRLSVERYADSWQKSHLAAARELRDLFRDYIDRSEGRKAVDKQPRQESENGLYTMRVYDGFDNHWVDCLTGVSLEEAQAYWNEKTKRGTEKTDFNDIDYYDIFPAETRMLY
jgi:hypothetical protein